MFIFWVTEALIVCEYSSFLKFKMFIVKKNLLLWRSLKDFCLSKFWEWENRRIMGKGDAEGRSD